jgi:hypothetical protein
MTMNRTEYRAHLRNIKDNGLSHTLTQVDKATGYTLVKLDMLASMEDFLAMRVRWIKQDASTRKNIIKLTSPFF